LLGLKVGGTNYWVATVDDMGTRKFTHCDAKRTPVLDEMWLPGINSTIKKKRPLLRNFRYFFVDF
jgi:hypothetical protein